MGIKKVDTYFYVLLDQQHDRYFYGFANGGEWVDNLEYCYYTKNQIEAIEKRKQIAEKLGVICKVIRVSLLEV